MKKFLKIRDNLIIEFYTYVHTTYIFSFNEKKLLARGTISLKKNLMYKDRQDVRNEDICIRNSQKNKFFSIGMCEIERRDPFITASLKYRGKCFIEIP